MLDKLRSQIEKTNYWDARVVKLECNYFCDEVVLAFEDSGYDIQFSFSKCYKIEMSHDPVYAKNKPYKDLTSAEIPYFIQNIEVKLISCEDKQLKQFELNLWPMNLCVVCDEFHIKKIPSTTSLQNKE